MFTASVQVHFALLPLPPSTSSMRNSISAIKLAPGDHILGHERLEKDVVIMEDGARLCDTLGPHSYVIRIRSTRPGNGNHFVMAASVTVLVMDAQDSGLVASAGTFISTLIDPVARHTPAANESRGDERLMEARKVAFEYESVIDADGRTAIDDRIA